MKLTKASSTIVYLIDFDVGRVKFLLPLATGRTTIL